MIAMTQDQYGQARGPGYVVHGDVVPEDETEEARTGESRPMTRFQKVASALRGGSEQDEQDQGAGDPGAEDQAVADQAAADRASADRTAADAPAAGAPPAGPPVAEPPATSAPAGDIPASADEVPAPAGITGRHAAAGAAAPTDAELRPGEASGTLGDFSDLTYGNLIPDTALYTEQWQQIQFRVVDDPHPSVTEAADVIAQVTAKMEAA